MNTKPFFTKNSWGWKLWHLSQQRKRLKPYTNFETNITTLETAQEPSKTNHDALEAIRKMQSQGRVERPITGVKTTVIEYPKTFNDWSNHIRHLLITK